MSLARVPSYLICENNMNKKKYTNTNSTAVMSDCSYSEITINANLIQQGTFINVFLARHVSGTYVHHQEHWMLSCSMWFSAPSFWVDGGIESRCVGRVYGADGAENHMPQLLLMMGVCTRNMPS